ncbi:MULTISPECIES: DUF3732 domain-containing protein [unclassified Streptomyces]|uniref:DUF3732 domain-containing protein n=1 Tax=unclassified Streptomyces TaxID=2593676 RepID=UPI002DD9733A|nr:MULTISPECIES: DUF3732 domain-containing protein [unclassified Streptomyces]WSF81773.1 DUF3732 domain-containing protein [Streptomyces sp. NBC_01744]WSC34140.1 DUF3732 domain-containing protein [Streptomyces sp. NBC_01763]WSC41918.1 DUF3732 domain-containing protein [Streptomyces sp. NBC_01763]WSC50938.1 DUF3732 domain-containing protein [Streptomyces sp. NBC_01761]WSC58583.1 DUF3732 domain-containing protein [Streptomyces sp. NBC_01761]
MTKCRGRLEDLADDEDCAAVRRLFQLMHQVTADLSPNFQMIVSDHADLPDPWFQQCVRYNWRDGDPHPYQLAQQRVSQSRIAAVRALHAWCGPGHSDAVWVSGRPRPKPPRRAARESRRTS